MRENRTYGSEGGEPAMDNSPTPITGFHNCFHNGLLNLDMIVSSDVFRKPR